MKIDKVIDILTEIEFTFDRKRVENTNKKEKKRFALTSDAIRCAIDFIETHGQKKTTKEDVAIGSWLSAAMEDEKVCAEMKKDIENWFNQFDIFGDKNDDLELPIDETR